jgi:hypothetical protein
MVIALVAMTSMIGALSMVIDAGVYYVLQRQLQNAADAAALAAVWYAPACNSSWSSDGQQSTPPTPPTACQPAPTPVASGCPPPGNSNDIGPCTEATNQVKANESAIASLCNGPLPAGSSVPVQVEVHPGERLVVPQVGTYVVTVSCDSPHWFARVFPSVCTLPACAAHVSASAAAALGWLGPNGELMGTQPASPAPAQLVARLVI